MYVSGFDPVVMPFNAITDAVLKGQVDAGLIIHEGQLTYEGMKLVKVLDLGQAWVKIPDYLLSLVWIWCIAVWG